MKLQADSTERPRAAFYPLALLHASAVLFALHLRRALWLRSTLLAVLAAALPVGLAALILWLSRESELGSPPVLPFVWLMMVRAVVPLTALLIGAGVVAEEVDDRTITYLFVRPIPRPALLLGRWSAAALILSVLLASSSVAVLLLLERAAVAHTQLGLPAGLWSRVVTAVVVGGLVYSALFAALGTWLRHPVIVGAGYVFAVEGLLGTLPGEGQSLTIQFYLKSYLVNNDEEIHRLVELIPEALGTVELVSAGSALTSLFWIGGVALVAGALILARRQLVLPS